jgi:hypothetical protein
MNDVKRNEVTTVPLTHRWVLDCKQCVADREISSQKPVPFPGL